MADQLFDTIRGVGTEDEAGVMMAIETVNDLRRIVAAGVGMILPREADDTARVLVV